MVKATLITIILLASLVGCNFKPINNTPGSIISALEASPTKIEGGSPQLAWEFDRLLTNDLMQEKKSQSPLYRLEPTLAYETTSAIIQGDSTVSRFNIKLRLKYRVFNTITNKLIAEGTIRSGDSFDVAGSPFSNYVADEESKRRIFSGLIADLHHRLYAWS